MNPEQRARLLAAKLNKLVETTAGESRFELTAPTVATSAVRNVNELPV